MPSLRLVGALRKAGVDRGARRRQRQEAARSVDVHRQGRPVLALDANDTLDGIDVLAGFTCAVRNIFDG